MITNVITQSRLIHILKFIEADRLKTKEYGFLAQCAQIMSKVGSLTKTDSEELEKIFYETQWRDSADIKE